MRAPGREAIYQLMRQLVDTYGEIVIEDLYLAGMARSMGRRAFRRSPTDADLGGFRPMLGYKTERPRGRLHCRALLCLDQDPPRLRWDPHGREA